MISKVHRFLKTHVHNVDSLLNTINRLKEILGIKEKHRIYNSILNPSIWATENSIKPEVLNALLRVANTFYKDTELTVPLEDIYYTHHNIWLIQ